MIFRIKQDLPAVTRVEVQQPGQNSVQVCVGVGALTQLVAVVSAAVTPSALTRSEQGAVLGAIPDLLLLGIYSWKELMKIIVTSLTMRIRQVEHFVHLLPRAALW